MSLLILILITVLCFCLYGVVGQDKSLLLGPAFVISLAVITAKLMHGAWRMGRERRAASVEGRPPSSVLCPPSSLFWLLFLLWGFAMISSSVIPFDSALRMIFIAAVIGAFMVWGQGLTAFKDNRIILGGLIFIVVLLALYGLVIHFKSPMSILWTERYTDHYMAPSERLASTYICPNHFAHIMQMLLPFCVALLFIPQAGLYLKILAGYGFLALLPPMFFTESRAGWLGSIAAVGVVCCLMALRRSKKLFAGLVILVPLCSVLLLAGAWRFSETFQRRAKPVVVFLQGQAEEGLGSEARDFRPQTWLDTLDMIKEQPIFGYGPGTYRYAYPEHRKRYKGARSIAGHPHNEYLELIADFGLVGFGLFALAWMYGSVWVLVKSLKAEDARHAFMGFAFLGAVAGTMVHSFFDFQMHIFPNAMLFALLAALAIGPLRRGTRRSVVGSRTLDIERKVADDGEQKAEGGMSRRSLRRRENDTETEAESVGGVVPSGRKGKRSTFSILLSTALLWMLGIGFLVLTALSVPVLGASAMNALADKKVELSRSPESMQQAEDLYASAIKWSPQNWRAYSGMGKRVHHDRRHTLERDKKLDLAREELAWFDSASILNPKDPESLIAKGKVLLFLHRYNEEKDAEREREGLELIHSACDLRKFNDLYWWILGVELRKSGFYEEALDAFRHMETIKRTKSSRKNIQWLEAMIRKDEPDEVSAQPTAEPVLHDIKPSMEAFKPNSSETPDSLDDLFELMKE